MNVYLFLAIFLLVDLLLIVYVLYRKSRKKFSQRDLRFFRTQWNQICESRDGKHAVLDADKLLHAVLKKKGYEGSVGDQLKKAGKLFTNVQDLWSAHKLRNRIAHELDMHLMPGDRDRAVRSFQKALKDLGAL